MSKMPKIGPTGKFRNDEPITKHDRGGINIAVRADVANRRIIMDFHTELDWLAAGPAETIVLVQQYRTLVKKYFGELSYDASTLPIKVTANQEKRIIESRLPSYAGVLMANPELFLGWADHLETAVGQLKPPN